MSTPSSRRYRCYLHGGCDLFRYPIGPNGRRPASQQRSAVQECVYKVFYHRIVQIGMSWDNFTPTRVGEFGSVERIQVDLPFCATDSAFVAADFGMPTNIYDPAHAVRIVDYYRGIVFYGITVHRTREGTHGSDRLAEKEIQQVNAMGSDVKERATSRFRRIDEPPPGTLAVKLTMRSEFREHWFSYCTSFQ